MLEELGEISLLYDFYGNLLPEKQREFLRLYHEENYTFAEIAEDYGLSRQGVFDAVSKAQKKLEDYESKLGLAARLKESEAAVKRIDEAISALAEEYRDNTELVDRLKKIMAEADRLGE